MVKACSGCQFGLCRQFTYRTIFPPTMFNSYSQHYASNSSKVFFAISYLKKSMLEWFEIGVMESDPRLALTWCASWPEFLSEIRIHFGPSNPTGTVEIELHQLSMQSDSCISEYIV